MQAIFVPCNGMYSVRVCARARVKVYMRVQENREMKTENGILLANERDCKRHQKKKKTRRKKREKKRS